MRKTQVLIVLLTASLGFLIGTFLPTRPAPSGEVRIDVPGCDGQAAWRLAAVEALFDGKPRRPDIQVGRLGQALCQLAPEPREEENVRAIAADPSTYHALGLRIHAAWTAYAGEQPRLPPEEIDRLRRSGADVLYLVACIQQASWLLQDSPFGMDPIALATSPKEARHLAILTALRERDANPLAAAVCEAAFRRDLR